MSSEEKISRLQNSSAWDSCDDGEKVSVQEDIESQGGSYSDKRNESSSFVVCGERLPINRMTFIAQIIAVYSIIIVSAINLSINSGTNQKLWIALLTSAFGYVMPNPGLKYRKPKSPSTRDGDQ